MRHGLQDLQFSQRLGNLFARGLADGQQRRADRAALVAGYAVLWVPVIGKALGAIFVEWEIGLVAVLCNLMVTLVAMLLLPAPAHGAK